MKIFEDTIRQKADESRQLAERVRSMHEQLNESLDEIGDRVAEVTGYLTTIRVLREGLEQQQAEIEAQVMLERQSRMGRDSR